MGRVRAGRSLKAWLLLSASLAVMTTAAQAQNVWIGATSDDWSDGSNWSLGAPPLASDQVIVNSVSPNATVGDLSIVGSMTGFFNLSSLDIGSVGGAVGDLTFFASLPTSSGPQGYTGMIAGAVAVGLGGGTGTLTFDLTATDPTVGILAYSLNFGVGAGSLAQINVLGTGTTIGQQSPMGPTRSVGMMAMLPGDIVFGDQGGTAHLVLDGAGGGFIPAFGSAVVFGRGVGSTGTVNVLNGGKGAFGLGNGGDAIFGDAGGSAVATADGRGPDGTPSRLIFGGGTILGNGQDSTGTLNVLAGGKALSMPSQAPADPQLGVAGGTGIVTISGPGSVWNIIGQTPFGSDPNSPALGGVGNLHVGGPGGTGVLTLADGGTVALGQGAIVLVQNTTDPTLPQQHYEFVNFTPGLGTAFVGTDPGSTGTVNFGAPAGAAPAAPGTLDAAAVELGGNGRIVFNHTDPGFQYGIPTSGTGTVQTLAGTTVFTTPGAVTHTGPTLIDGGILRAGAVDVLSPGSQHSVGPAGQLDLAGFNQTVADTVNAGLITMNPAPGAVPGTTLTVVGNYVGQGGAIAFNTVLGSDGSPTDLLVIDGGSGTGDTRVRITNAGGLGALTVADGIRLVETQNGATTAGGAFRLDGRVAVGAYEYQLLQGGNPLSGGNANDGNWYLRNTVIVSNPQSGQPVAQVPNYRLEVPLYTAMPGLAHRLGFAALGTFHERTGEVFPTARQVAPAPAAPAALPAATPPPLTRWCKDASRNFRCPVTPEQQSVYRDANPAAAAAVVAAPPAQDGIVYAGRAAWGRVYGETGNHRPGSFQSGNGPSYDYGVAGVQAGMDVLRREEVGGPRDQLGFYVGYAQATADVGHVFGGDAGSITLDGYTIGGYWTHFGAPGWYVDAVAQVTRFDGTARSSLGERLPTEGWGATLSLEGGYPIALGSSGWTVEPQAQLVYQRVSLDSGADRFGRVDFEDSNALLGRIGARVARSFTIGADEAAAAAGRRLSVWGRANLWHAFGDDPETTFSSPTGGNPVSLSTSLGGTWAQVGLGVAGQVTESVGLYASADYSFGLDSSDSSGWGGRGGIRIVW